MPAAVVTGGASGLGLAVVEALAARGYRVLALDLEIGALAGIGGVEAVTADVRDAVALAAALDMLGDTPLRVAVSCAGIAPARRLLSRDGPHDLETFTRTLEINLTGTFNLMRFAAARMVSHPPDERGERGVIVNTASIAAYEAQIGQCAYAASKGAVAAMTLPAARELAASAIRVVALAPGLFATPMIGAMPERVQTSLAESVPFPHRLGRPHEFASMVMHVVDNPYLNGAVLRLDAALRMGA